MGTHIHSLQLSTDRLRARVRDPYDKIESGTKSLGRLQEINVSHESLQLAIVDLESDAAVETADDKVEVIAKAAVASGESTRPYKVLEVTSYLSPSQYTAVATEEAGPAYIARSGPTVHVV